MGFDYMRLISAAAKRGSGTLSSAWKLRLRTRRNLLNSIFLAHFRFLSSRPDFLEQEEIVFSFAVGRSQVR